MCKPWLGMNRHAANALLLCVLAQPMPQTQAASFDCAQARTEVERRVCADATLSGLDEDLARVWREGRKRTAEPERYRREQRAWVARRDTCLAQPDPTACLRATYKDRIQALSGDCWRHGSWDPAVASAGAGHPVSGRNWPLCRIVLENLNRFCQEPPQAEAIGTACAMKLDSGITSLRSPEWLALDAERHLAWISQRTGREFRDRDAFVRYVQSREMTLSEARFDLTNDGHPERVINLDTTLRKPASQVVLRMCALAVINEGTGQVDRRIGFNALHSFQGRVVFNAGKTYLLRGDGWEWELVEPFTVFRNALPDQWRFGETRVCLFEHVTH